jgi:transcriptional regulator with XRE-family HTH domain
VLRLTRLRISRDWSKTELGRRSRLHPATVGQIESGRLRPYDPQLNRLARALKWDGPTQELLEEVGEDEEG